MNGKNNSGIIYTLSAKCQDCYRCLRMCPVKAIDIVDGQAYVDSSRCIVCGKCIKECPQGAKTYRNDIETVVNLIKENERVVVSIAPSVVSFYNMVEIKKVPSVLRKLGFWKVLNTSEAVDPVIKASIKCLENDGGQKNICTSCPVVINYIEKYKSSFIENIVPVLTPMITHGKLIKATYGNDVKIVFIGPCIAKKEEAQREEAKGIIDAVLTFQELNDWIKTENIDLMSCESSDFDRKYKYKCQGTFPLPGQIMDLSQYHLKKPQQMKYLNVAGKNILELLEMKKFDFDLIELLFCDEGCINGPGGKADINVFDKKLNLLNYYHNVQDDSDLIEADITDLEMNFIKKDVDTDQNICEDKIREILALTGKEDEEHRLNCGACGYNSCEDKAKAVYLGRAEAEMCIPHMRRLAEKKTDIILDTIPNGFVLLDHKLEIMFMNSAFKENFICSNDILGRRISYLFDSDGYERLLSKEIYEYDSIVKFNRIEYHQHIYTLKEQNQFVGIYSKISQDKISEEKLFKLKEQVIHKIIDLRDQQIKMSHDLALLLGDNSAKVEEILWRLMDLYE